MLKQIIEIIINYRGFFSLDQVVSDSGWDRAEVKHRLDRLEAEGLIRRQRETPGRMVKRPGGPAPKEILYVKRKGLPARLARMVASQQKNTAWDKIWRTIRVMRRVTSTDLIQITGAKEDNVRAYLKVLSRDGWIKKTGNTLPVTWALVRDPGPDRPRIPWKLKKLDSGSSPE